MMPDAALDPVRMQYYQRWLKVSGEHRYTMDFTPLYVCSHDAMLNAQRLYANTTPPHVLIMMREPVSLTESWINYEKARFGEQYLPHKYGDGGA